MYMVKVMNLLQQQSHTRRFLTYHPQESLSTVVIPACDYGSIQEHRHLGYGTSVRPLSIDCLIPHSFIQILISPAGHLHIPRLIHETRHSNIMLSFDESDSGQSINN